MPARLYERQFTVPGQTPQNAPAILALTLEDANLDTVRIIVPPGHSGLTGLQVQWSGAPLIPIDVNSFIVTDDEKFDFPYDGEVTANGLSLAGFNLDIFPHTFFLRFQVSDLNPQSPVVIDSATTAPAVVQSQFADISGLTGSADDSS